MYCKLEINKMNNSVNAIGIILPSLWKLYPLNISNIPTKILSIRLWCTSDFKIKIKIIKKSTNLIFFCFENNDKINISVVKLMRGT